MAQSSLLSSAYEAKAEGYVAKQGVSTAQIMSINPDGSIGLSTISEWKYEGGKVYVRLTQGQNALNLSEIGATGTLLIKGQGPTYLLHLKTINVVVLQYSAETAGQFDQYYSGAANALNEYDITFEVPVIEQTFMLMFCFNHALNQENPRQIGAEPARNAILNGIAGFVLPQSRPIKKRTENPLSPGF